MPLMQLIKSSFLFDSDGSLLASAGENASDCQVVAAINANIWRSYDRDSNETNFGKEKKGSEELDVVLLECEVGRLVVAKITKRVLLCLCGDEAVEYGMLRVKANTLREYLKPHLLQVIP